mgnify:CR=1 FL=1
MSGPKQAFALLNAEGPRASGVSFVVEQERNARGRAVGAVAVGEHPAEHVDGVVGLSLIHI